MIFKHCVVFPLANDHAAICKADALSWPISTYRIIA